MVLNMGVESKRIPRTLAEVVVGLVLAEEVGVVAVAVAVAVSCKVDWRRSVTSQVSTVHVIRVEP